MSVPCDILDDLTKVGGRLVEQGIRKYPEWVNEFKKHVPGDISEGTLQRVWGKVHVEMSNGKPNYFRANTSSVFIEQLKNRFGWNRASDFVDELGDNHEDILNKLLDDTPLSPDEQKTLAGVYRFHAPKKAKATAVSGPYAQVRAALQSARIQQQATLRSASAPRGPKQNAKPAIVKDNESMEGAVRDSVARRIGKDGAKNFIDAIKSAGLYNRFITHGLNSPDRAQVLAFYKGATPERVVKDGPQIPALNELDTAMTEARDIETARRSRERDKAKADAKAAIVPPSTEADKFQHNLSRKIGKDRADSLIQDLQAHPEGLYDKLVKGDVLTDPQKSEVLRLYKERSAKNPSKPNIIQSDAVDTINDIIDTARKDATTRLSANDKAQNSADSYLHSMEQFFPDTKVTKKDAASEALNVYKDGARELSNFAAKMKREFGDKFDSETLQSMFQDAAREYQARKKPVEDLKREMFNTVRDELRSSRHPLLKAFQIAKDTTLAPLSLTTALDMSALRQGSKLLLSHPVTAIFNRNSPFVKMLESAQFGDNGKAVADAVEADIKTRKLTPEYDRAGLHLSEWGEGKVDFDKGEEVFRSELTKNLPWVKWSERNFVTFLNKLRADTFDLLYSQWFGDTTPTDVEAQALGNFINVATGRASNGRRLQGFASAANGIMFSPRNRISQFQWALGQPLYGGSARTRKGVAKEYAKYLTSVGTVFGMGLLAQMMTKDDPEKGVTVFLDPHSKDYGNIRVGNVMITPFEGALKPVSVATRLFDAQKATQTGKMRNASPSDTLGEFARTTLSPQAGSVVDFVSRGEENTSRNPAKSNPRNREGGFKADYGKDFLNRDVTEVGGVVTDATSAIKKSTGSTDDDITGMKKDDKTRWLRAADYYLSKNAIPITATGVFNAFAENGIDPTKIPLTLLAIGSDWFGANSRVMDSSEMGRRGFVKDTPPVNKIPKRIEKLPLSSLPK